MMLEAWSLNFLLSANGDILVAVFAFCIGWIASEKYNAPDDF